VRGLAHWFAKVADGSNTPAVQKPGLTLEVLPLLPLPPPQPANVTRLARMIQRSSEGMKSR